MPDLVKGMAQSKISHESLMASEVTLGPRGLEAFQWAAEAGDGSPCFAADR